jgi:hypothetical protein
MSNDEKVAFEKVTEEKVVIEDQKAIEGQTKRSASYFTVVFGGFALFSDGYQSGVISFVNLFLGKIYGDDVFNADMKSRLSYSLFVGAIIGQLGKKMC